MIKRHSFKIGYIVCECGNDQHRKYDECKECGEPIDE